MSGKFERKGSAGKAKKAKSRLVITLCGIAVFLVVLIIVLLFLIPKDQPEETVPTETTVATEPTTEPTTVPPTTVPPETEAMMLDWLVEYYEKNPDIAGWIKIEGTKLDNPVMYVEGDNSRYLYKDFNKKFHASGLPYIKGSCTLDPQSDNWIIYGHNMLDGTMFGDLELYAEKKYWEEHPIILLSTLYEEREYEIVAAFFDRLYDDSEDCFKFYNFIAAVDEEDFNEAIAYYKEHAEYETGVEAKYGDHLITLVTCSYHCTDGRFVVVARQVVDEAAEEPVA